MGNWACGVSMQRTVNGKLALLFDWTHLFQEKVQNLAISSKWLNFRGFFTFCEMGESNQISNFTLPTN